MQDIQDHVTDCEEPRRHSCHECSSSKSTKMMIICIQSRKFYLFTRRFRCQMDRPAPIPLQRLSQIFIEFCICLHWNIRPYTSSQGMYWDQRRTKGSNESAKVVHQLRSWKYSLWECGVPETIPRGLSWHMSMHHSECHDQIDCSRRQMWRREPSPSTETGWSDSSKAKYNRATETRLLYFDLV